jgi:hydroxyacyl-ACP dehydratase HTD2-like protein with hotdog domain
MPIEINKSLVGREYPPYAVTVERGKIKEFARGTDISRILHGEQEFELFRPLQPGRTYLCRAKIIDIYEKTGRSGPMAFVIRETSIADGANEIVATMRGVTVVRL